MADIEQSTPIPLITSDYEFQRYEVEHLSVQWTRKDIDDAQQAPEQVPNILGTNGPPSQRGRVITSVPFHISGMGTTRKK
jgi:hypothetical protein